MLVWYFTEFFFMKRYKIRKYNKNILKNVEIFKMYFVQDIHDLPRVWKHSDFKLIFWT